MRTAVILTGQLRTISKTIRFLKQNVVFNQQHVFACLQNDSDLSDESWEAWFHEELPGLRKLIWFSEEHCPEWIPLRTRLVEALHISDLWKDYLKNSGSMIEYYQLYLAYHALEHDEQRQPARYDYVIRMRTDSVFFKPIDFHWLEWSVENVAERWNIIAGLLHEHEMPATWSDVFRMFMGTLLSDDLLPNIRSVFANTLAHTMYTVPDTIEQVRDYIHSGRYVIGVRTNNLYVVRRELFHLIPSLGTMYGLFRGPHEDAYWFNAENQFINACYHAHLTVHTYSTLQEEHSLAHSSQWNASDFFDDNGAPRHAHMLYCIVRR